MVSHPHRCCPIAAPSGRPRATTGAHGCPTGPVHDLARPVWRANMRLRAAHSGLPSGDLDGNHCRPRRDLAHSGIPSRGPALRRRRRLRRRDAAVAARCGGSAGADARRGQRREDRPSTRGARSRRRRAGDLCRHGRGRRQPRAHHPCVARVRRHPHRARTPAAGHRRADLGAAQPRRARRVPAPRGAAQPRLRRCRGLLADVSLRRRGARARRHREGPPQPPRHGGRRWLARERDL